MNALLRKEVRLLLPSFVGALVLSFSLWLVPLEGPSRFTTLFAILSLIACPALTVMMALDSFGKEISAGTFPMLLAQPAPRTRLWRMKTGLLGATTLIVLLSWVLSFHFHFFDHLVRNDPALWKWAPHATAVLFALVTFSGGLWTVLFFRQVTAAFWFTLIVPAAILTAFIHAVERYPVTGRNLLMITLALYSVAGFFFARWLFLRAQDLQPGGGEIALPRWRACNWRSPSAGVLRQWRPRAALWRKELQLHQSQFVLAALLLLVHLAVIIVRKLAVPVTSGTVDFVLHAFWVLWLFIPLLVGCTAVAEERKLGTLEGQLCLPAKRRRQFIIKFLSTLLLSVLLGAMVPVALEGKRILPNFNHLFENFAVNYANGYYYPLVHQLAEFLRLTLPFLTLAGIAVFIVTMAFYASTLARNTLQSLAPAVLGLLLVWGIFAVAMNPMELIGHRLWNWPLALIIGVPVMAGALAGLMFWNFKRVFIGWPVWRHNVLILVGALAFDSTTTAALYHRVWEFLAPLEPAHGPTVLAISPRVNLRHEGWRPLVELPDGRVWTSYGGDWDGARGIITPRGGDFLDGTNWMKFTATHRDLAGLREDGSLWVSAEAEQFPPTPRSPPASARLVRLGTETNWVDLVTHQFQTITLLKADGSLWELGTNRWSPNRPYPGLRAFTPRRLGADSDWTALSAQLGRLIVHQRDGQLWVSPKYSNVDTNMRVLSTGLTLFRAPDLNLDAPFSVRAAWKRGSTLVAVLPDGTFRAVSLRASARGGRPSESLQKSDAIIGTDTDWLAVAGNHYDTAVTLKADGTVWKWEFPEDPAVHPDTALATQLGTHSDWVAVHTGWGGLFALAGDGSLWLWRMPGLHLDRPRYELLAPTRRPERMGNIFEPAARSN